MPNTPPLILEGHMQTKRRSKLWSVIALLAAMEVGAVIERRACNHKDEAAAVKTPDAKAKEEQEVKRKELLELSRKCHMDLLLDLTRNKCKGVTEASIRRQYWECENLRTKSDKSVAGI